MFFENLASKRLSEMWIIIHGGWLFTLELLIYIWLFLCPFFTVGIISCCFGGVFEDLCLLKNENKMNERGREY